MRQTLNDRPAPRVAQSLGQACCLAAALLAGTHGAQAQDRGLAARPDALGGAAWHARFEHDNPNPLAHRSLLALAAPALPAPSLRLLSDYQFNALRLGDTGGLRLTGGVLINLKAPTGTPADNTQGALPYAGIGYSSGSLRGDWGFSADLGLAAPGLSSARIDRLFNNSAPAMADAQPRLLPMIRLGMSMAF